MKKFIVVTVATLMISMASGISYAAVGNLPFVGERTFNFMGGNATQEAIYIKKNGIITVQVEGSSQSFVLYEGKYKKYIPIDYGDELLHYYHIKGNQIYRLNSSKQLENNCYNNATGDMDSPCIVALRK